MSLELSYVLPLRTPCPAPAEFTAYLDALSGWVDDVIVVDGSEPAVREHHRCVWPSTVSVLEPARCTLMGKVGGVVTGVAAARHEKVVVADDDVRYDREALERMSAGLDQADIVRPQNYFEPRVWHAVVDTARSSLNRVTGGDWPGTLGIRRSELLRAGGYAGDVLFENLELVRTLQCVGATEAVAFDLFVRRIPPSGSHFARQQVRQAYDEFARPVRLVISLAVLPVVVVGVRRRSWILLTLGAATVFAAAESGRRRDGARRYFSAWSSLLAPAWLVHRSACAWIAVGARLRGGARYRDVRIRIAAHSTNALRRRRCREVERARFELSGRG